MTPFLGQIMLAGFNYAPGEGGWVPCDGRLLPIAQYSALYSLIGTRFGGDGITNFALPDLRGRVGVGMGTGTGLQPIVIGQKAGAESVALTIAQVANHSHTVLAEGAANAAVPDGAVYATAGANLYGAPATPVQAMSSGMIATTGQGQAHENRMPFLALNYVIATEGLWPSRP